PTGRRHPSTTWPCSRPTCSPAGRRRPFACCRSHCGSSPSAPTSRSACARTATSSPTSSRRRCGSRARSGPSSAWPGAGPRWQASTSPPAAPCCSCPALPTATPACSSTPTSSTSTGPMPSTTWRSATASTTAPAPTWPEPRDGPPSTASSTAPVTSPSLSTHMAPPTRGSTSTCRPTSSEAWPASTSTSLRRRRAEQELELRRRRAGGGAAVDGEDDPGDLCGPFAGEEHRRVGDVLGCALAREGLGELRDAIHVVARHPGADLARHDAVHADAVLGDVEGDGTAHVDDGRLRRPVGDEAGAGVDPGRRRQVDDRAAAVGLHVAGGPLAA